MGPESHYSPCWSNVWWQWHLPQEVNAKYNSHCVVKGGTCSLHWAAMDLSGSLSPAIRSFLDKELGTILIYVFWLIRFFFFDILSAPGSPRSSWLKHCGNFNCPLLSTGSFAMRVDVEYIIAQGLHEEMEAWSFSITSPIRKRLGELQTHTLIFICLNHCNASYPILLENQLWVHEGSWVETEGWSEP